MVSLDLAKAFDSVPHMEIQKSLEELGVDMRLIAVVMRVHTQTQCVIRQAGREASTMMQRGLRQGCPLAPVLYAAWTSRLCDTLGYWDICSTGDMRRAIREVGCLFSVFQQLGLTVNIEKSGVMLSITGTDKYAMLRACACQWKGKNQLRVPVEGGDVYVPIVAELLYLGVVLAYTGFEHATVQHRLGKAQQRFGQLSKVLRTNSGFGISGRLRVYRACVWSSMRYGLIVVGLTQAAFNEVVSMLCIHLRKVLRIHVRGVPNTEVLCSAGIDPHSELLQASTLLQDRLEMDVRTPEAKGGELRQVKFNIQRLRGIDREQHGSSLIEIESTPGQGRSCDVCGLSFGTAEGLTMHVKHKRAKVHYDSGIPFNRGEHALHGVPVCRLCRSRMYDWSSLRKHVASGLCSRLKWRVANEKTVEEMWSVVLQQEREDPPEPPPGLEAGLEVIEDTANMEALRRACSICGQRLIQMQRIKTHWQHTHKDAWESVRAEISGEMTSLQSVLRKPCQFCGSLAADLGAHSRQCFVLFQLLATRLLHRRGRLTTARQRAAGTLKRQDKSRPAYAEYTIESSPIGKALGLSGSQKSGRADPGEDSVQPGSGKSGVDRYSPGIANSGAPGRPWTLNLVLANPGNHCYANASVLALCHAFEVYSGAAQTPNGASALAGSVWTENNSARPPPSILVLSWTLLLFSHVRGAADLRRMVCL